MCCGDCGSRRVLPDPLGAEKKEVAETYGDTEVLSMPIQYHHSFGYVGPIGALFLCLVASYLHNWQHVTRTHCNNWQFWPSISSVIGNATPQRYIWRIGVALSLVERVHDGLMYFKIHQRWIDSPKFSLGKHEYRWLHFLRWAVFVAHYVEQLSLLMLTYISSSEWYAAHEMSFIFFAVFSNTHMIAITILDWELNRRRRLLPRKGPAASEKAYRTRMQRFVNIFRVKLLIIVLLLSSFLLAAYLFVRHNTYCEDGVYSVFAMLEWLTVVLNISFHVVIRFEFPHWNVIMFGVHASDLKLA